MCSVYLSPHPPPEPLPLIKWMTPRPENNIPSTEDFIFCSICEVLFIKSRNPVLVFVIYIHTSPSPFGALSLSHERRAPQKKAHSRTKLATPLLFLIFSPFGLTWSMMMIIIMIILYIYIYNFFFFFFFFFSLHIACHRAHINVYIYVLCVFVYKYLYMHIYILVFKIFIFSLFSHTARRGVFNF